MIPDKYISAENLPSERKQSDVFSHAATHQLKCWPEFFQAIVDGLKTHDLRRSDDRRFRVGDRMLLREFSPRSERYSGRQVLVEISYVTSTDIPCALSEQALNPAYCILSIRKVE
jgi:hypothetical protein